MEIKLYDKDFKVLPTTLDVDIDYGEDYFYFLGAKFVYHKTRDSYFSPTLSVDDVKLLSKVASTQNSHDLKNYLVSLIVSTLQQASEDNYEGDSIYLISSKNVGMAKLDSLANKIASKLLTDKSIIISKVN